MKYFIGFLVCIALIVGVFILVLRGFSGHSTEKAPTPLSSYSNTDVVMQMTVDGPIVNDAQHQAYRISVSGSDTTIETLQGYQYNVITTRVYPNNSTAYDNFLRALQLAGFNKGDTKSKNTNERGVCPTGDRYVFQIVNGSADAERYWSASCTGGNFKGNTSQVKQLFNSQIPPTDFNKLLSGLNV